ncbi:MAG: hypothetical protein JXR96_26290 [Deltaproteobacteria bacterium]|nr:hypothetical protein [Deltaproteobacteria bacterium]
MKNTYLVCAFYLLLFLGFAYLFAPRTCLDFPCSMMPLEIEPEAAGQTKLFISVFPARSSGGGCEASILREGESIRVGPFVLSRRKDQFWVDGQALAPGASLQMSKQRLEPYNPWFLISDTIDIQNKGPASTGVRNPAVLITGAQHSDTYLNWVTLALFSLLSFHSSLCSSSC